MKTTLTAARRHLADPTPDRALVRAYADTGDERAFAELVRRHASTVRRAAADIVPDAADDVMQATFLLLGRKAAAVASRETAAGWLFRTARLLACKARTAAARRRKHESHAAASSTPVDPLDELTFREVRQLVAEELDQLPESLRIPLLVCYWEGETHAVAAARLGSSLSTLKRRLDEGRQRLAARLARRGVTGPALLAALVGVEAAARVATPPRVWGAASPLALELVRSANRVPGWTTTAGLAATLVLGAGLLVAGGPGERADTDDPPPAKADAAESKRVDRFGDPLPPGAVARMGSARLQHGKNVREVAVAADGSVIVSRGHDESYKFWDGRTGKAVPFDAGDRKLRHVGPGGKGLIALAARGESVEVLSVPDGAVLHKLTIPISALGGDHPVSFSADGRQMAWGQRNEGTSLWEVLVTDLAAGRSTALTSHPKDFAFRTRFSADGSVLAVQYTRRVEVWDVARRERLVATPEHQGNYVPSFDLSADGSTLVVFVPVENAIRVWDVRTGKERPLRPDLPELPDQIKEGHVRLAISPDGRTLAYLGYVHRTPHVLFCDVVGHKGIEAMQLSQGSAHEMRFSADGKRLLGACGDGVAVWDVAARKPAIDFGGHHYAPWSFDWSPDGKTIVSGAIYSDPVVRIWDAATGEKRGELRHPHGVNGVAFSPDGKRIATCDDGSARIWDAASAKELRTFPVDLSSPKHLAFGPDGGTLYVGDRRSTTVRVFDVDTGRRTDLSFGTGGELAWLQRRGDRLLGQVLGAKPSFVTVDPKTREAEVQPPPAGGGWCVVSPDGRRLVAFREANDTPMLLAFGPPARELGPLRKAEGSPPHPQMTATFSPDGRTVAIGYRRGSTIVYELATRSERRRFDGHVGDVLHAAFSPDGTRLATSASDKTLLVWDVTSAGAPLPASIETAWADLASPDAVKGYAAVRYICERPETTAAWIGERLAPVPAIDPARVAEHLAALDSPRFAQREAASKALAAVADAARLQMEAALSAGPSTEARRRLEAILATLDDARPLAGEALRAARAVEALEWSGSAAGRALLAKLAGGAPGVRLTRDAAASVERLGRRR